MSLLVFILPAGRHAMLLQCANMYAGTGHSNTKHHTKYNIYGLGTFRDTLCIFSKVNYDLATQLLTIVTGLMTQHFACNV